MCTMRHEIPRRRPLRIKGYDYTSPGAYFVTICARQRRCVFGDVLADAIVLSRLGQIVHDTWREVPLRFPNVELDEFVVMPNHLHGLLLIKRHPVAGAQHPAPAVWAGVLRPYTHDATRARG